MPPRSMTWGEIYQANLARGYDHGYAAWRADQAEEKAERKRKRAARLTEADAPIVAGGKAMTEPKMHRLVFMNSDSKPKNVTLDLAIESVPHVMALYGAHFAGDRYTVALDGRDVPIDGNGEPVCDVLAGRVASSSALAEADAPIVERE